MTEKVTFQVLVISFSYLRFKLAFEKKKQLSRWSTKDYTEWRVNRLNKSSQVKSNLIVTEEVTYHIWKL